jgi:hypothetical protein
MAAAGTFSLRGKWKAKGYGCTRESARARREAADLSVWLQGYIERMVAPANEEEHGFRRRGATEDYHEVMEGGHLLAVDFEDQIATPQPSVIGWAALFDVGHYDRLDIG